MIKISKAVSLLTLGLLQLIFLTAIFFDLPFNIASLSFISITGLLIPIGIYTTVKSINNRTHNNLLLILFTIFGSIVTYVLATELNTGAVIASALVGTVASFIPLLDKKAEQFNEFSKAIYCGSFVGMTATFISQGYLFIFLAGLAAGILYILSKNTFIGVGGKLGTMAFGGVVIAFFLLTYSP